MARWRGTLRRLGVARTLLCALLLASLLYPPARELQWLCVRLLFRFIPQGDTEMRGQEPGDYVPYPIPRVDLTLGAIERIRTESGRSVDHYVLARALTWSMGPLVTPPLAEFEAHPLAPWAALGAAARAAWPSWDGDYSASTAEDIEEALAIVAAVQNARPGNGALWLAEAALHFGEGRAEAALDALRVAARKGGWDAQCAAGFRHVGRLRHTHGLPPFETSVYKRGAYDPAALVLGRVREGLRGEVEQALAEEDDERLRRLLTVQMELSACVWRGGELCRFRPSFYDFDLAGLMLCRLAGAQPRHWGWAPLEEMSFPEERAMADACLALCVGRPMADELHRQQRAAELERGLADNAMDISNWWLGCYQLLAWAGGTLVLCVLPFALAALLMNVPFRMLARRASDSAWPPRSRRFWVALAAVVLCSAFVMASAWDAAFPHQSGPQGLWLGPAWPYPDLCLVLWVAWGALQVYRHRRRPIRQVLSGGVVALGLIYLAAVLATAYVREALVVAVASSL